MGTYTTLAKFAGSSARSSRGRYVLRVDAGDGEALEPFPFACPECEEGAVVATDCPRCGVEMRSNASTIRMPRRSDATDRTQRSLTGPALALGVASLVPAVLWIATSAMDWASGEVGYGGVQGSLLWSAVLVALTLGAGALIGLGQAWPGISRRLASRGRLRSMRARADALPVAAPTRLGDVGDPVRIVGRVVVEDGVLRVTDGACRVRVPVDSRVRVFASDGERHVLSESEEVEVVGVGRRVLGAGDGYRDVEGEFVFDPRGCEVWVRG